MKRLFFVYCWSLIFLSASGQDANHHHTGWYLSVAGGPAFGTVNASANGASFTTTGTAAGVDVQIGAALRRNLMLHATFGLKTTVGPTLNGEKLNNRYFFTERRYGAGLTQYTASNFFVTADVGVGKFLLLRKAQNFSFSGFGTDPGFGYQLKGGKEWKLTDKWAVGAAAFWSQTLLRSETIINDECASTLYAERWSSRRFGVYLVVTFCSGDE